MTDRWIVLKSDEEILKIDPNFSTSYIPNDRTIWICSDCPRKLNLCHWHTMWDVWLEIKPEMILCEVPRVGELAEFSDDGEHWRPEVYFGWCRGKYLSHFNCWDNIRLIKPKRKITIEVEVDDTQIEQIKALGVNVNG